MKKIIILIVTASILLSGIFFYLNKTQKTKNTNLGNELNNLTQEVKAPSKEEQIDILRNRFSLRWVIMKGDNYFENNQLILALNEYLKAHRQSPTDTKIISKIAWVYFETRNFAKAHEFYALIGQKDAEQQENYVLSLLYQTDLDNYEDINKMADKIKELQLSPEERFYYMNALNCSVNLHECKKYFENFIKANPTLTFQKLKNVKQAFENYKNFQTENLYYKDALLIWEFYKDRLYNISSFLWEKLLVTKPDYKPVLLIIGKWYYELGKNSDAQKSLLAYYQLDPRDISIAYLLWNIYFKQRDYASSNIYYNVALRNNFEPKIELQRKLIYNYYLLDDKRSMLNIFSYLMDEEEANIEDYSLGIYHAILSNKKANAMIWSERGIKKFEWKNGVEIFYGYMGWIEREAGNIEKAEKLIKDWLNINPRNPLLTLNNGYLEKAKGNNNLAMIYFKRTINLNWEWEFGELAQKEVEIIESILNTQSGTTIQN